jgi:2-dehydro-3-deoxyphosphogalactonate aldolase
MTTLTKNLKPYLSNLPFIAILRGIQTHECEAIVAGLYDTGFRCIEIPLNSPDALASIELLAKKMPADCLLGAGTVLSTLSVNQVAQAGGKLIVMPHCDTELIVECGRLDLFCTPGVATLSEAFAALKCSASALKLFPSESVAPSVLKNWRTVLPKDALCLPVGGVKPEHMKDYFAAGANGFGLGAALYQPGMTAQEVKSKAENFKKALD